MATSRPAAASMFRPRPFSAEGRAEIMERQGALSDEASALEIEHQQRATRMGEIRHELTTLRDALAGRHRGNRPYTRLPRLPAPAPIGRPAPPAVEIWGRRLRYAALGVLLRAGKPLTLPEIHRALHATGFALTGRHAVKQLADALAYEHDHGRARRVRRGVYAPGELSPYRRRKALEGAAEDHRSRVTPS